MPPRDATGRMAFLHICLNVSDAEESIAFFEQLGFEESWLFTTDDGRTENRYVADENGVEIQLAETAEERTFETGDAWDHLAVSVDDLDETLAAMTHYGVVKEPTFVEAADARVAFVEDPDGHVVELIEPL
jgi:lactoylglutathione lyase